MTREECLKNAQECVCGQREQDYGTPESNFQIIADLWNAYLCKDNLYTCEDSVEAIYNPVHNLISPKDVAMMMALLKIARIRNGGGTGDSFVDLAGYAACGAEIFGGKDEKVEAETGQLCYSAVADAYYSSPIDGEDIVNRRLHCSNYSYSNHMCAECRDWCTLGGEKLTEDGKVAIITDCPYYKDC